MSNKHSRSGEWRFRANTVPANSIFSQNVCCLSFNRCYKAHSCWMKRTCQAAISSAITCFRYVTFTCEWWDGKLVYSVWLLSRFSHLFLLSDQTGNSLWNILSETPPSLHTQTCTQLLYGLNGFSSRPVSISCVVSGSVSSMMSGTPCSVGVTLRFRWAVAWSSVSSSPFLTSAICDESGSWSPMSVWSEVLVC